MFKKPGISGQLQNRPDLPALHQLLSQALENRGKQMLVAWRSPGMANFTLVVICSMRGEPRWCFYGEQSGKREMLFDYASTDVLLVMSLISSSCDELQKSSRGTFTGLQRPTPQQLAGAREDAPPQSTSASRPAPHVPHAQPASQNAPHQQPASPANHTPPTPQPASPANHAPSAPQPSPVDRPAQQTPLPVNRNPPVSSPQPPATENLVLHPRPIDAEAIQSIMIGLRRQDTGMFLYPAFLYFLEQEYFRSIRSRSSLSVILLEIREITSDQNPVRRLLPPSAVLDGVVKITALKRHVDVLAHYDSDNYALLLPHTKKSGARAFANRLIPALSQTALGGLAPSRLSIACGSASIPEDFVDLSKLLGAADLALKQARITGAPLVMYADIKDRVTVPE